jgi:CubicO group peptidase (beta-lactamase class C family)
MKTILFACSLLFMIAAPLHLFAQESSDNKSSFYCPPCGSDCDKEIYKVEGICKTCGMALLEKQSTTDSLNPANKKKAIVEKGNKKGTSVQVSKQVNKLSKQTITQIDKLFDSYNKPDSPGYAIGIFRNGKVLYKKGYGMANLDYNLPITPESVFNVASLSKQFTAACIALLILRDSLSLEDEVKQYIPEVAKYTYPIKVKHLVYMTSGIKEYHSLPHKNGLNWNLYDYFTVDTAIAVSLKEPTLEFEPGTKWAYSNVNYMLLTKIVEKVSGKRFAEFARENLFTPLGMQNTQFNDDVTEVIKNRATGYLPLDSAVVAESAKAGYYIRPGKRYAQLHRNAPHYGGSGLFTSINDWYKWNQNFYDQKLGGKVFYELMHKRMKFAHSKDNDAFGLVHGTFNGQEIIWYAGGDLGFNSYVMRFPAQELTVVCFSNVNSSGGAEKYARQIGEILFQNNVLVKSK